MLIGMGTRIALLPLSVVAFREVDILGWVYFIDRCSILLRLARFCASCNSSMARWSCNRTPFTIFSFKFFVVSVSPSMYSMTPWIEIHMTAVCCWSVAIHKRRALGLNPHLQVGCVPLHHTNQQIWQQYPNQAGPVVVCTRRVVQSRVFSKKPIHLHHGN